MHTVLSSPGKTVVIGDDQPFCIIGERINPTGRKKFQEQLRAGDLSAVEEDVRTQVDGGAMVLDVNMGVPLTDEAELLAKAVKLVQSITDLPLCIDSSVVEALEAGLAAYEGKALVNSVTAEDDRMELILPLVKKYGAAVIALPNDET
ncbi:MAG: dihydropteroate synthase, partial [Actinomycetota bacterium]|nr:dihydropteroate synthase [Actinomycetota bacterium]